VNCSAKSLNLQGRELGSGVGGKRARLRHLAILKNREGKTGGCVRRETYRGKTETFKQLRGVNELQAGEQAKLRAGLLRDQRGPQGEGPQKGTSGLPIGQKQGKKEESGRTGPTSKTETCTSFPL